MYSYIKFSLNLCKIFLLFLLFFSIAYGGEIKDRSLRSAEKILEEDSNKELNVSQRSKVILVNKEMSIYEKFMAAVIKIEDKTKIIKAKEFYKEKLETAKKDNDEHKIILYTKYLAILEEYGGK